jgi:hypothetical protein
MRVTTRRCVDVDKQHRVLCKGKPLCPRAGLVNGSAPECSNERDLKVKVVENTLKNKSL